MAKFNGHPAISLNDVRERFHIGQDTAKEMLDKHDVPVLFELKQGRGIIRYYDERSINDKAPHFQAWIDKQQTIGKAESKKRLAMTGNKLPAYAWVVSEIKTMHAKLDRLLALWDDKQGQQ